MPGKLAARVALVTGGGRGIGAAVSARLASEGAIVVVTDISKGRAQNVAERISGEGGKAYALELDVTDPAAWTRVIEHVAEHSKRLDILVNNAGLVLAKYVEETSLEEWQQTLRVNLEGPFLAVKTALPLMRETATLTPFGGSIVNMSSVSGMVGTASLAAYTASKGGLRFFSRSIALDFARRGYRLRANSVHPGLTEGESANALFASRVRSGQSRDLAEAREAMIASYPIGRMGRQEDVANGVLFLASDESAFVTGTELVIDGGRSA
jgi:3(or 17)beta-hydroxysteroid dehydrogenase